MIASTDSVAAMEGYWMSDVHGDGPSEHGP